jgi:hypothetical protein
MLVTVTEIGKWGGIKIGKEYIKASKFAQGLPEFEVGKTYDIEIKENVSKTDGKTYKNIVAATEITAKAAKEDKKVTEIVAKPSSEPVLPAPAVKKASKAPVAFGRELSDYELLKDRRIGVAGVVQAVLQSTVYVPQIELMEPGAVDKFLAEKAEFWLSEIKRLSEK